MKWKIVPFDKEMIMKHKVSYGTRARFLPVLCLSHGQPASLPPSPTEVATLGKPVLYHKLHMALRDSCQVQEQPIDGLASDLPRAAPHNLSPQ